MAQKRPAAKTAKRKIRGKSVSKNTKTSAKKTQPKSIPLGEHLLPLLTDLPNKWLYYPAAHLLYLAVEKTPLTATAVTIMHIIAAVVGSLFLFRSQPGDLLVAFAIFQLRAVLDCLDGTIARRKNMASEIGRILDNLGDAIGFVFLMVGLVVYFNKSGRLTAAEISLLFFSNLILAGLMALGTDFYRRKFTSALRENRDIISEAIAEKYWRLQNSHTSLLLRAGYWMDWLQIYLFTPTTAKNLRAHIRQSQSPAEYRADVEYIRSQVANPLLKLALFGTAMMAGDNAVFIILLGFPAERPEWSLYANIAYSVIALIFALTSVRLFFRGAVK